LLSNLRCPGKLPGIVAETALDAGRCSTRRLAPVAHFGEFLDLPDL